MNMLLGVVIGMFIGLAMNGWILYEYKSSLISSAKIGTPENIRGKFYYIKEEKEF